MGIEAKDFGERLVSLLPQLMKEISRYENNYVTSGKITCQQFLVLEQVSQKPQWKMNELVQVMDTSFSSTTEMLDRLDKHGLVQRIRGEEDRRTVFVKVTRKGHKILEEIYDQKKEGIVELFKRLNSSERADYLRIIEKLVQSLSSVKGESR
ncbi:MAG: MarR family transcriptional regulator [Candidatus Omnitrophica bacterium]|nr:MarR family transcriptional regulator [Candidatus Omnitrophota bacterium]MCB9747537.1 MarR family transcriptional regulator [Candidatus Omnitrophota bacterium]